MNLYRVTTPAGNSSRAGLTHLEARELCREMPGAIMEICGCDGIPKVAGSGRLVLQRMPGESITIGDDIRVTVSSVSGTRVRLAITAPKDLRVRREELPPCIESK